MTQSQSETVIIGNPCLDGIFQYGFADPFILRDFLNTLLSLTGKAAINLINYLPRDMPSSNPLDPFNYHFTVDVRCKTYDGRHFLVEMQNDFRDDYHMKALMEHARMMSRLDIDSDQYPEKRREFWKDIQGIYTLVITNKQFPSHQMKAYFEDEPLMEPHLLNVYELRHTEMLERHYGDIPNKIVMFMLANFDKSYEELSTEIDRWAYVLRDPNLRTGKQKIPETKTIKDPASLIEGPSAITSFLHRIKMENLPFEVTDRYRRALYYHNGCLDAMEKKIRSNIIEDITAEVTAEVTEKVKQEVTAEVTEKVKQEVTEKVKQEVTAEVTEKVTEEVAFQKSQEIALVMLQEGEPDHKIIRYSGLSAEDLMILKKSMFD